MKCQLGLLIGMLALSSCETKTETGAAAGTGTGAAAGGLIYHSAPGVIIGGAVGAAGGAMIGSALDDSDRNAMQERAPKALEHIDQGEPLSLQDIKDMSYAGISDEVIINQIHATHSTYFLSPDDLASLRYAGVSQNVIDAMLATSAQKNL